MNTVISTEAEIRQAIDDWTAAFRAKDINRLMSHYSADVIAYDLKPPFQVKGATAWRSIWEECMPCFPSSFDVETRDLTVIANDDVAIAHWLFRFTGMEPGHPAMQSYMRATVGYRKEQGRWRIVHEHASVPINPETSLAVYTLEP